MDYIQIYLGLCYSTSNALRQGSQVSVWLILWTISSIFGMNPIEALIYNFSTIKAPTYSSVVTGDYDYPVFGIVIAFFLVLSSITMIPIYSVKGYNNELKWL